jgi:hypothetical protein
VLAQGGRQTIEQQPVAHESRTAKLQLAAFESVNAVVIWQSVEFAGFH